MPLFAYLLLESSVPWNKPGPLSLLLPLLTGTVSASASNLGIVFISSPGHSPSPSSGSGYLIKLSPAIHSYALLCSCSPSCGPFYLGCYITLLTWSSLYSCSTTLCLQPILYVVARVIFFFLKARLVSFAYNFLLKIVVIVQVVVGEKIVLEASCTVLCHWLDTQ